MLLVFDEILNDPEFLDGEMKALLEFQQRSGCTLRVLGSPATRVALQLQLRRPHRRRRALPTAAMRCRSPTMRQRCTSTGVVQPSQ